ncbi:MAG: peptide chain release factor N(5)-glutamine methyltransferase [Alphaproteobacteria bacterium]|nr:peptide chain release factor N(5)-glutamine methyltransferase [Alphaproteobacteria bacterium]
MEPIEALRVASARLAAISDTPRLDAELLLAHACGVRREALLLGQSPDRVPEAFEALIARRLAYEPVAYILGHKEFWGLELRVTPAVLIPRPDSETLIEAALGYFKPRAAPRHIVDLGTGSGALLLAALSEWPEAHGLGVDASEAALGVARGNAEALGLAERACFQPGDWCAGLEGRFDLILCNPPYVENGAALAPDVRDHEPHSALFAGADGLDDYRRLIPQLPAILALDGIACLEVGHTQREAVSALAAASGLTATCRQDLGGRDRCLILSH